MSWLCPFRRMATTWSSAKNMPRIKAVSGNIPVRSNVVRKVYLDVVRQPREIAGSRDPLRPGGIVRQVVLSKTGKRRHPSLLRLEVRVVAGGRNLPVRVRVALFKPRPVLKSLIDARLGI